MDCSGPPGTNFGKNFLPESMLTSPEHKAGCKNSNLYKANPLPAKAQLIPRDALHWGIQERST